MRHWNLFFSISAISLSVAACGGSVAAPELVVAAQAVPVRVATAAPAEFLNQIRTVGRVEPDRTYVLAFKTAGVVSVLSVQEGDAVTKGQVLAELDPRDVNAQLREAQEAADKAVRELDRIRTLHARDYASDASLQDAQALAKSTYAAAQAARSNQGYASIVAPADGVVLQRSVEANGVVAAGAPVMTLSDMSESFVLSAGLADRDALRVALGDTAEVTFDAFPDQVFSATISEIGADADARTGTFQIKLKIDHHAAPLKSGLVGRAAITPSVAADVALAIPVDAILEGHGDQALVFVVDPATGAATRTRISTGRMSGALVAVTAGLAAGDQIVVDGAGYLSDGEKVLISTASAE
ncbi:MAG: efflux RND transporter periplasmic adaptor subunit [Haliea sp.]|nr:efflux RND transporter periplasmic adaptor subunit [Haliea sp.]MBK6740658.1 efflux RND transporter periplasmic adaptor subunit [Haliea sp.]